MEFVEDQKVEVYSRASEGEACGWWTATVKISKGEIYVVEYKDGESTYTEIVPVERLRPKNQNGPIEKSTFYKFELEVPEGLRE